jgi:hypothetical protein
MPEVAPDAEVVAGLNAPQPETLKTPQQAATDADAPPTARALPLRSRRSGGRPSAPAAEPRAAGRRDARRRAAAAPAAKAAPVPASTRPARRASAATAGVSPRGHDLRGAIEALPDDHQVTPRPRPSTAAPRRRLRFAPTGHETRP